MELVRNPLQSQIILVEELRANISFFNKQLSKNEYDDQWARE